MLTHYASRQGEATALCRRFKAESSLSLSANAPYTYARGTSLMNTEAFRLSLAVSLSFYFGSTAGVPAGTTGNAPLFGKISS